MGIPDIVYECHEAETGYRLCPNPDAPPGIGYRNGAVLLHNGDGNGEGVWKASFFIAPEAMEAIGLALLEAAKDIQKEKNDDRA